MDVVQLESIWTILEPLFLLIEAMDGGCPSIQFKFMIWCDHGKLLVKCHCACGQLIFLNQRQLTKIPFCKIVLSCRIKMILIFIKPILFFLAGTAQHQDKESTFVPDEYWHFSSWYGFGMPVNKLARTADPFLFSGADPSLAISSN